MTTPHLSKSPPRRFKLGASRAGAVAALDMQAQLSLGELRAHSYTLRVRTALPGRAASTRRSRFPDSQLPPHPLYPQSDIGKPRGPHARWKGDWHSPCKLPFVRSGRILSLGGLSAARAQRAYVFPQEREQRAQLKAVARFYYDFEVP